MYLRNLNILTTATGLVPAEPPPAQRQEDQRAGGGFPQAQTTLH